MGLARPRFSPSEFCVEKLLPVGMRDFYKNEGHSVKFRDFFYPSSYEVGKISGRKMPLRNDRSQVPEIKFKTQFCRGALR